MANKKISELQSRTPSLTDLLLVGDPSSGYSYKCTVSALATIIETDIADGYVTIGTTQTISGAKTFSNNLALTSVSNANTDTDKFLVLNASNVVNFRTGAEVLSDIGGQGALTLTTTGTSGAATLISNVLNIPQYQGVISLASIGSSPNANGATLSSNTLTLQPASGSFGGVVTTGFQEFAGQKRFIGNPIQFDKHLEVKNIDSWGVSWGYTSLASKDTPVFGFLRGHSFAGAVTYYAWFTYGSTGERNYTLPSTDGTLALTSDITSSISGTTNYIPKFTGSNSIGNSVIYESSSNIGIGTISPNYPLHINSTSNARIGVQGTTNFSAFQNINSSGSVYWGIDDNAGANFTGTAYGRFIYSSGAYPLIFFTNSTERMRLDASGNLGIGTTSPAYRLQVEGAFGTSPGAYVSGTTYGIIGANRGASSASAGMNYYSVGSQKWFTGIFENTDDFGFYSGGTAGFPMVIKYSTGNVGIGTTAPSQRLHLASGTTNTAINISHSSNGGVIGYSNTGSTGNLFYVTNGSGVIGSGITMDNSGNVGIGTTSPGNRLHVYSTGTELLRLEYSGATGGNYIQFKNSSGDIGYFGYGSTGSDQMTIFQGKNSDLAIFTNSSERMRITSGGNLLLGTTTDKTTVIGASGTGQTIGGSGTVNLSVWNTGNADWVYSLAVGNDGTVYNYNKGNTPMTFWTNANERMRITSGGNVGIGSTTPTAISNYVALTINGTSGSFTEYQQGGSYAFRIGSDNSEGGFISQTTNNPIRIFTNSNERMRITSGGNVGIGTTTPGSKLAVVGLPTSTTGLAAGDFYRDGDGYVKVVL
jgi:hypothetical protein